MWKATKPRGPWSAVAGVSGFDWRNFLWKKMETNVQPTFEARFGPKPRPIGERFWEKVDRSAGPDGCWPWMGTRWAHGYGSFRFGSMGNGTRTSITAHRMVMMLEGKNIEGVLVCHHCDNPPCCNPKHLFLGTHSDNARDMVRKGLFNPPRGEKSGAAKITEAIVREARRLYALTGMSQSEIGMFLGINPKTAQHAISGRRWAHVS